MGMEKQPCLTDLPFGNGPLWRIVKSFKYTLEVLSPLVGWCLNHDIYEPMGNEDKTVSHHQPDLAPGSFFVAFRHGPLLLSSCRHAAYPVPN